MSIKSRLLFTLSALLLVIVAAAPSYHHTRPCVRCGIPERDYQYERFSQSKRSLSDDALTLRIPLTEIGKGRAPASRSVLATEDDGRQLRIKSFQFVKAPTLQIDHCSISQMSVLLDETGRWTVSMRANQNPLNAQQPLNVTTIQPNQLFTDHLRRNKFYVVARCFVRYGPGDLGDLTGKPLVIPLYVKPFWVQKQDPYQLFQSDFDPHIERYFDAIDRVEIEFAYQRD